MNKLSLSNNKAYNFETNIGHKCNMRCKFCFEQHNGYPKVAATFEMLSYFADYMLYTKKRSNCFIGTTIYGGEPFSHIDTLVPYVEKLSSFINGVVIVTNGLQIIDYSDEIKYMKKILGDRLSISVSYNFSLQDETRQCGTYETVRNSIRWLCSEGFYVNSPVVFTPKTIHKIGEVFDDFMNLYNDTGGSNRLTYNYYKDDTPFNEIKEDFLREELHRIGTIINNKSLHKIFSYSMIGYKRGDRKRDCLFASVCAGLSPDGIIYPGYDVCHSNKFTRELLKFGKVGDDFELLDKNRLRLVHMLDVNPPLICKTCSSQCRVIPWRTLIDDVSQYNKLPHPERCKVIGIINEYLSINRI
jgi:sulfatase maturation enzyme AslB (radical SAM superfamily)